MKKERLLKPRSDTSATSPRDPGKSDARHPPGTLFPFRMFTSLPFPSQRGTLLVGITACLALTAKAQHDIQRNAVQKIALGQHEQATTILAGGKKPDAGKAETLFVETLNLAAQDKIEEAISRRKDS